MLESASLPLWPLLAVALSLFAPLGASLLVADEDAPRRVGTISLVALLITLVGYAATGFAIHFGGIGILIDHPDVATLVWEWTPLKHGQLSFWGVAGWMGFGMAESQSPLAALLFLSALPLAATASLLAMTALWKRTSAAEGIFMAALIAFVLAPLVGNWTQAGGWLMHLGQSLGAGDGYLDFGGASFFLLAGGVALAALLAFRDTRLQPPTTDDGLFPALGASLLIIASIGWIIASPLQLWMGSSPIQGALNGLLALTAGGLIGLAYSWFILGEPGVTWTSRCAAAGWVAALAAIPWISPLQSMLIGAVAAWIYIMVVWLVRELLGWYDPGDLFSVFGPPAGWGLLVAGFFAPSKGQFRAQIIGVASIFLLAFFVTSIYLMVIYLIHSIADAKRRAETISEPEPDTFLSEQ